MASSNTSLKVTELDFSSIKDNLKTFLQSQSEFTDYDFEGSGLSVLLDVLAYNTYYNAFYLNMAANESFLDTAQVRKNILSHAKTINYIPNSNQGSLSKINVTVTPSPSEDQDTSVLTINKYTQLVGRDKDGINYNFVTINSNTAFKQVEEGVANTFNYANLFVKQGEVLTNQFLMSSNNSSRRFELPSANVDVLTLSVTVQESASNTHTEEYLLAKDITEIKANSKVYFLEENDNLRYTIQFGDSVIGQRPANGNIIIATYLESLGSIANNISDFKFAQPVGGLYKSNVIVKTVKTSYGGSDKETIEQIRFRAPYAYIAQNRAVTKSDYEVLLVKDYNNIDAVSVWGGEDNDPVVYGKVFMSIKTKGYYSLTELEKDEIKNQLIRERNILTVIPEIVEPDFCFVLLRGKVTYNVNLTNKTPEQLQTSIRNAILQYSQDELNTFKSTLRKSKLLGYIDSADPSITGSDIDIFLQKRTDIQPNETKNYEVFYNAPLQKGSLTNKLYSFPELTVLDNQEIQRKVYIEEVPTSLNGIYEINITDAGANYTSTPTVTITGDGQGATARAKIINGRLSSVDIIDKGYDYTQATVAITAGSGTGATAAATVDNNFGILRTYYYKNTGEKVIVNPNIGTIDYYAGKIILNSFKAVNAVQNSTYANNVITINTVPQNEIISPLRNRILTLDANDSKSIIIELVKES
jgi:hypothetical protein